MKYSLALLILISLSPIRHADAAAILIAFHNGGTTLAAMNTRPPGVLVDTFTNSWNNVTNNTGIGLTFSNVVLSLSDFSDSGATISGSAGASAFNNNGWGTQTQDWVMMEGWYGLSGTESLTVSNLSADFTTNGYTVTIYGDSNDGGTRVMDYTVNAGPVGSTQTLTDSAIFTGTFDASNTLVFTGLNAADFTITGNAAGSRSAVNGIIIQSIPEPTAGLLALAGILGVSLRRQRS